MPTIVVPSGTPATLLVAAGDGPTLVSNSDVANTVYLGTDNSVSPSNAYASVPLMPGQWLVFNGDPNGPDWFATCASGQTATVLVIPGGMSFFQPITQLVIQGTSAAILLYAPFPGLGNLIGSWAAQTFVDAYGNVVPGGINANGGVLNGVLLSQPAIVGGTIVSTLLNAVNIASSNYVGGTVTETTITFDSTGGVMYGYATTTTTQTFNAAGFFNCTIPAGVSVGDVRVWGGDAGAGGGSSARGGEGGGGAEMAREPNYALVPGVYTLQVGDRGTGGTTGVGGNSGGDSFFDSGNIYAQGGQAGSGFVGGQGGNISTNSQHFKGGNGGGDGTQSTGGCGGGGRAGLTGAGGNGAKSGGSAGAAGGTAGSGTGGHAGGNGGAAAANGNAGGGGGGAGAATAANSGSNSYRLSSSTTYYGSDATGGNANGKKSTGTMWQGGETASGGSFNGTQKSVGIISGNPQGDLSGKTIDSVNVRLEMLSAWYNSGATVYLGYNNFNSAPSTWNGSGITSVKTFSQSISKKTTDVSGTGFGSALQSGAAQAITLGPGSGSFNLTNYCSFYGAGGDTSQDPLITVNWHTGSTPVQAGNGGIGLVTVTYSATSTLVWALSPVIGTDASSNAYAVGYTGPVQAIQPLSNPTAVETWHNVSLPSGFTAGVNRYKYLSEINTIMVDIQATGSYTGGSNVTFMTLPTGYTPTTKKSAPLWIATSNAGGAGLPRIDVNISGAVATSALPNPTTTVECVLFIPLD